MRTDGRMYKVASLPNFLLRIDNLILFTKWGSGQGRFPFRDVGTFT